MNNINVTDPKIITSWQTLAPIFHITNDDDYDHAIEELDQLLDIVGDDETHLLYGLLDTLGTLVSVYEDAHFAEPQATGIDALKFLMEEHGLNQSDLPEIGSQGVVSELLSGKRELNKRHILTLAERFNVAPATFL